MSFIAPSVDTRAVRLGDAPPKPVAPLTVTVATARQITGLSATLYALIKEKKINVVKVGARTLMTYASLEALLQPMWLMVKRVRREPNLLSVAFERDGKEAERLTVADGWLVAVVAVGLIMTRRPLLLGDRYSN
jgi:hypothetical protein